MMTSQAVSMRLYVQHVVAVLLGCAAVPDKAQGELWGDFEYSSDGVAITITDYVGEGGSVTIPESIEGLPVTGIGDSAFNFKGISSVTLPDSVTIIGNAAFLAFDTSTNFYIPAGVREIGGDAFGACHNLRAIDVDAANQNYSSDHGVLYTSEGTQLVQCPAGRSGAFVIPSNVTQIGGSAFFSCQDLTSLEIGSGVTNIGANAFFDCRTLTSIVVPDSVTDVGDYAFNRCQALLSITIGEGVTNIGARAFAGCISLSNVAIGGSVESIGYGAFDADRKLFSITFPASVKMLGDEIFIHSYVLRAYFLGDPPLLVGETASLGGDYTTVYYLVGSSGWGDSYGGRPSAVWNPRFDKVEIEGGEVTCTITGTVDIPVAVDVSSDPASDPWTRLIRTVLSDGKADVYDATVTNTPGRMYRIVGP